MRLVSECDPTLAHLPAVIRRAILDCVSCGACQGFCPVYRAGRREELAARGKLALVAGLAPEDVKGAREVARALERCLLCGRCSAGCPNQVRVAEALLAARQYLGASAGGPGKFLAAKALPLPSRLDAVARLGRLAGRAVPLLSGLHLRLAGRADLTGLERLPPVAGRFFLEEAPREIPGPKGAPRLGVFVGCVGNYLRPELPRRLLALLRLRYTLVVPPGQGCCGLPALAAGRETAARELARRNLAAFREARVAGIVTACVSCAATWRQEYFWLLEEETAGPPPVWEASQLLGELRGLRPRDEVPIFWHEPCHLRGAVDDPLAARQMAERARLPVAAINDACCGGGGTFAWREPKLSRAVFAPLAAARERSGAAVVATPCSGCFLQWRRLLPASLRVVHPLELVAWERG